MKLTAACGYNMGKIRKNEMMNATDQLEYIAIQKFLAGDYLGALGDLSLGAGVGLGT